MKRILVMTVVGLLQVRCAAMGPPTGGPEDKTPPVVLSTLPTDDSVRVDRNSPIEVLFSEKMNRESVERALFLAPHTANRPELRWDKNTLMIVLKDSLPAQRTCVVTLGTDAKDVHNNGMVRAYTFAFSTGDSIDQGSIRGRVVHESRKNVTVGAYRFDEAGTFDDSVVYRRGPDYATQADAKGRYELAYLAPGKYRLIAMVDTDDDGLYTPGADGIGMTFQDAYLRPGSMFASSVDFMLSMEDTTRFVALSAEAISRRTVRVSLNRALRAPLYFEDGRDFVGLRDRVEIVDSLYGTAVPVLDAYLHTAASNDVRLLTEPLDTGRTYHVRIYGWISSAGDTLSQVLRIEGPFDGDAVAATYEWVAAGGRAGFLSLDPVVFRFDRGVSRHDWEKFFGVRDTLGHSVPGRFQWRNSSYVRFVPTRPYESRMPYTITVQTDSIRDWEGMVLGDTATVLTFYTFKRDSLGVVSGEIQDTVRDGRYVLQCRNLTRDGRGYEQTLEAPGRFEITDVIPGRYQVTAFRDRDGNGVYSYGRISPAVFAESFASYPDTVTVRPNWETANVVLRFGP